MALIYELVDHVNTTDTEEDIFTDESSEAERITIKEIRIVSETLFPAFLRWRQRRELIGEHLTLHATIRNWLIFEVERELPIGDDFTMTLQNEDAGSNAEVTLLVVEDVVRP